MKAAKPLFYMKAAGAALAGHSARLPEAAARAMRKNCFKSGGVFENAFDRSFDLLGIIAQGILMKNFLLCCVVLFVASLAGAVDTVDLTKPLPRLRLADGRILQNVEFRQFKALEIFVKHNAGFLSLRYEALPDDIRASAEQKRPGGPRWFPGDTATASRLVAGQVFVQTPGMGPYKFGEVTVYAFAAEQFKAWDSVGFDRVVRLPKALSQTTTDGDGRFKLNIPKDTPFFLFCQTSRVFSDGSREYNEWRVPGEKFKNLAEAILNSENTSPRSEVVIEATP